MAKILIIGGGVSGLSAGIYAQLSGHQAIVCEMGARAGGNLTGWQRGEYHIDNCIHWLTGTNPATDTYKMWVTLGALGGVGVLQGESLYTYELNGQRLSLYRDLEKTEREMLDISPADAEQIRCFTDAVKAIQGICGILGRDHNEKSSIASKIASLPLLYRYYSMTTGELSLCFEHPLLRGFMTCFLGEGFGALALIFVVSHFCGENAGIPEGGSVAMADRMVSRLLSLGGQLYLNKKAESITVRDGIARGAKFADGAEIDADYVIITVDPSVMFGKLVDAKMPKELRRDLLDKRKVRFSCIQCAFACETEEPPFSADLIFDVPLEYRMKLGTKSLILREFSHEKRFAPSGCTVIQSMIFCDEQRALQFIELAHDKESYDRFKRDLSEAVRQIITDRFPDLDGKIRVIDVWTPATYKRYVGSEIGSFMAFTMPARTLPLQHKCTIPEINNLLLATQWQQSPGGLPIAAECGRSAIKQILRLERRAQKKHEEYRRAYSQ